MTAEKYLALVYFLRVAIVFFALLIFADFLGSVLFKFPKVEKFFEKIFGELPDEDEEYEEIRGSEND